MARIQLIEITARTDYSSGSTVLRYATAGYTTRATDMPADTYYDPRVLQCVLLRQELPRGFAGAAAVSYGELVLANGDAALSHLVYLGLDGQELVVREGSAGAPYATFGVVLRVTMEQAVPDGDKLRIRLKDSASALAVPLLIATYAGNNSLPAGLEGGAELKGRYKPRLYGKVLNLSPMCVNTSRLIYQVHDGAVYDITAAFDRGVSLTRGTDYTSQADMEGTAPSSGQYRVWKAGGMLRLGSTPAGLVTADAQRNADANCYWWRLLWQMATDAGVSSSALAHAEDAYPVGEEPNNWGGTDAILGLWVQDQRTALDAMSAIAQSVGAWFGKGADWVQPDKHGGQVFPLPYSETSGEVVSHYEADAIVRMRGLASPEDGGGVPAWKVTLGYRPVLTLQTIDVDSAVGMDRRTFLASDRLQISASDSAIRTKHARAVVFSRDTQIQNEAAADDEAVRLLELLRFRKQWFEVIIRRQAVAYDNVYPPILGHFVRLSHPELRVLHSDDVTRDWGYFYVMVLETDYTADTWRLVVREANWQTL